MGMEGRERREVKWGKKGEGEEEEEGEGLGHGCWGWTPLFNHDIVYVLQNTIDSRINSATCPRSSSQPEAFKPSTHREQR